MFSTKVPRGRCAAHVAYLPVGDRGEVRKVSLKDNEVYLRLADGSIVRMRTRNQIRDADRAGLGPVMIAVSDGPHGPSFFPSNKVASVAGVAAAAGVEPGDEIERLTLLDAAGNPVVDEHGRPVAVESMNMQAMRDLFDRHPGARFQGLFRRGDRQIALELDTASGEMYAGLTMPFGGALRDEYGDGFTPLGFKVTRLEAASPAERAGLQVGESILGVVGRPGLSVPQILEHIRDHPGEKLELIVQGEGGTQRQVALTPVLLPGEGGEMVARIGIGTQELLDPAGAVPPDFHIASRERRSVMLDKMRKGEMYPGYTLENGYREPRGMQRYRGDGLAVRGVESFKGTFGVRGADAAAAAAPPTPRALRDASRALYGNGSRSSVPPAKAAPVSTLVDSQLAGDRAALDVIDAALTFQGPPATLAPAPGSVAEHVAAAVMLLRSQGVDPVDDPVMMARIRYAQKLAGAPWAERAQLGSASLDAPITALEETLRKDDPVAEHVAGVAAWIADAADERVTRSLRSGVRAHTWLFGDHYGKARAELQLVQGAAVVAGLSNSQDLQAAHAVAPTVVSAGRSGRVEQVSIFDDLDKVEAERLAAGLNEAEATSGWSVWSGQGRGVRLINSGGRANGLALQEDPNDAQRVLGVLETLRPGLVSGTDPLDPLSQRLLAPEAAGVLQEHEKMLGHEMKRVLHQRNVARRPGELPPEPEDVYAATGGRRVPSTDPNLVELVRLVDKDGDGTTYLADLDQFSTRAFLDLEQGRVVVTPGAVIKPATGPLDPRAQRRSQAIEGVHNKVRTAQVGSFSRTAGQPDQKDTVGAKADRLLRTVGRKT